jgi:hypothetical protein
MITTIQDVSRITAEMLVPFVLLEARTAVISIGDNDGGPAELHRGFAEALRTIIPD